MSHKGLMLGMIRLLNKKKKKESSLCSLRAQATNGSG